MAPSGLEAKVAGLANMARAARKDRDEARENKRYLKAVALLTKAVDKAIAQSLQYPEKGIAISRICARFVLKTMPDPSQAPARATFLSQCQTMEDLLTKVRAPQQYLAEMQSQFGPDLDPRHFPKSQDAFNSIIRSQKNRISQESKGLNTEVEQNFCKKRGDLLTSVEKAYNKLRATALST